MSQRAATFRRVMEQLSFFISSVDFPRVTSPDDASTAPGKEKQGGDIRATPHASTQL